MTRTLYSYDRFGAFAEYYLEYDDGWTFQVIGVFERERGGDDLLRSNDLTARMIAAAIGHHAQFDKEFIRKVREAEEERAQEERALDGKPRVKTDAEYHSLGARALGVAAE